MKQTRGDYFQFGLVFIKKSNQTEIILKKPKPVQTDRFRLCSVRFFRKKTGSNQFGSVFSVWPGFFPFFGLGFGSVFSVSGL